MARNTSRSQRAVRCTHLVFRRQVQLCVVELRTFTLADISSAEYLIPAPSVRLPISKKGQNQTDAGMSEGGGNLVAGLGTRRGCLLIMIFWSLACASHALATSFAMLAISRFLLGMGEGGGFPAATRVVAEWFSVSQRATAMGIIN